MDNHSFIPSIYDKQSNNEEFVKCVVIGDTAVGKTRLICSYLYDQKGLKISSFSHKPHVPTVLAIDQYVTDNVVRRRSQTTVDGIPVQVRIWDTFGNHEWDRRFAFQNAHVIILCYNIGSASSLRNVNSKWYPEIMKFCPRAPIILIGTQLDRRYSDPLLFNAMTQITTLTDLLTRFPCQIYSQFQTQTCLPPELGRQTSKEINAMMYQEVSIVTKHGVNEVFQNAIRAALIHRKQYKSIFSSHLKYVQAPLMLQPYLPPKPTEPTIILLCNPFTYHYTTLLKNTNFSNVTILVEHCKFLAHSTVLMSSSQVFRTLFSHPALLHYLGYEIPNNYSTEHQLEVSNGSINGVQYDMPRGFYSLTVTKSCANFTINVKIKSVSPSNFQKIIEFLYTGEINNVSDWKNLLVAANYLQEDKISRYISNILNSKEYNNSVQINNELNSERRQFHLSLYRNSFYADIGFIIENVLVPAHKQVLVSQCAMMSAMFKEGVFKESMVQTVSYYLCCSSNLFM